MVKENEWVGKNVDMKLLAQRIVRFFEDDGFKEIRSEEDPSGAWHEIQARKTGVLRTLGSSRKAIHIMIKGNPNKFEIEMGVGEWGKNIAVAALLTGGIGLIELGFDAKFQSKLWNYIKESVDSDKFKSRYRCRKAKGENHEFWQHRNKVLRQLWTKSSKKCPLLSGMRRPAASLAKFVTLPVIRCAIGKS